MAEVTKLYEPQNVILFETRACFHDGIPEDLPSLVNTGLLVKLDDTHMCATLLGRWFSQFAKPN